MKKEKFDVNNQEHRDIAKKYLSNAVVQKKPTWNIASLGYSSCPFVVSKPYFNIDIELRTEYLKYCLENYA